LVILDGTMSSLRAGCETNAGQTYNLLDELGPHAGITLYYEPGIQWQDWRATWDVMTGRGINRQIRRAYGHLATRYRTGDRIVLIGYSRGAYAVRSLAGVIDRVGLLQREFATVRHVRQAYRHYQCDPEAQVVADFKAAYCYATTQIEAVAVWDTVKALGLRLPVFWRWTQRRHWFHSDALGHSVGNGFHALALDETRVAYAPVLWQSDPDWHGVIEQVWFRGGHGVVGGQINGSEASRPLANIPLVWMLDCLATCGLPLPDNWRTRFECDPAAPNIGAWFGWSKVFLTRRKRTVGADPTERIHQSVVKD
jgi:uncharacterized protein (DUF2235 family)